MSTNQILLISAITIAALVAWFVMWRKARRELAALPQIHMEPEEGAFDRLVAAAFSNEADQLVMSDGSLLRLDSPELSPAGLGIAAPAVTKPGFGHLVADMAASNPVALAYATVSAASHLHERSKLDDNLLQAMEKLSGEQVENLSDFLSVKAAKGYEIESIKLRGHIGEERAAELFEQAGMDVEWPSSTNNPGWDLKLDGHRVNVKVTQDASEAARDHFADNPEIPMVVNADAANIPPDAIYFDGTPLSAEELVGPNKVIVAEGLERAGIEHSQDAAAGVEEPFGADGMPDAIPGLGFVTAGVRSFYKEQALMSKGYTERGRVAKNVSVDASVKGGGAFAGAKAGAMFDAATGGATLGLGTLAGAVIGGLAGSKIATNIKLRPLRDAQKKCAAQLTAFDSACRREDENLRRSVNAFAAERQVVLRHRAEEARESFLPVLWQARQRQYDASQLDIATAVAMLDMIADDLRRQLEELETTMSARRFILVRLKSARLAERNREAYDLWHSSATDSLDSTERLFDHVMIHRDGMFEAVAFLLEMDRVRRESLLEVAAANRRMTDQIVIARAEQVTAVNDYKKQKVAAAHQRIGIAAKQVKAASDVVRTEARAAGLAVA